MSVDKKGFSTTTNVPNSTKNRPTGQASFKIQSEQQNSAPKIEY